MDFSRFNQFPRGFWIVLAASFINQAGNMAIAFLVLYLHQKLHFNLAEASFAFASFSAGMLTTGMIGGSLTDRYGGARIMALSLLGSGLLFLCIPLLQEYMLLMLLCLLIGLAYGLYRPASQALVSQMSPPGMYKLTFSCYRLVINLGMSIGPAIGGFLAVFSFKVLFLANGAACLAAFLILYCGLRHSIWFKVHAAQKSVIGFRWLREDAALRLFLLGVIPVSMIFVQHETALPVFLRVNLQLPYSFYGLLFTLNTILLVLFELPLNIFTLQWPYALNLALGGLLIISGFAGLYFCTQQWQVLTLAVVWTLGEMIFYPAAASYIAEIAPEKRRGSYMSMYSTATNLGMLLGPVSGAGFMQYFGIEYLWLACGLLGLWPVFIYSLSPLLVSSVHGVNTSQVTE